MHLQRIYNFLLFHAIILSVLDVNGLYFTRLYYFWDKPINPRPSANCCFFAYFSVLQKKNIKRSPNGMKPSGELIFGMDEIQETWSRRQGSFEEATRQGGAPYPPGRAALPRGRLVASLTSTLSSWIAFVPKKILAKVSFRLIFLFCEHWNRQKNNNLH